MWAILNQIWLVALLVGCIVARFLDVQSNVYQKVRAVCVFDRDPAMYAIFTLLGLVVWFVIS